MYTFLAIIYNNNKMNRNSFNTNDLVKHFLRCTPINTLDTLIAKQSASCFINFKEQYEILDSTVNSDLIRKFPVKQSYQKAFLKWLMNKVEEGGGEVCDSIYLIYCNLISFVSNETVHFRHYLIEDDCISIQESTNIISEGTTGLCSWQGAIELSKWCMGNKSEFCGKVVLELGCGVGLTGLCVIKQCAPKQYIFTDCHESVLGMVSENVKLNLLQDEKKMQPNLKHNRLKLQIKYNNTDVEVMELRWEDINKYVNEQWIVPDIIIGADVLYDSDSFHALVSGLKTFLSFENRFAIIAATIRNMDTVSKFLHQLECHDLSFEECIMPQQKGNVQVTNTPMKILKIFPILT